MFQSSDYLSKFTWNEVLGFSSFLYIVAFMQENKQEYKKQFLISTFSLGWSVLVLR